MASPGVVDARLRESPGSARKLYTASVPSPVRMYSNRYQWPPAVPFGAEGRIERGRRQIRALGVEVVEKRKERSVGFWADPIKKLSVDFVRRLAAQHLLHPEDEPSEFVASDGQERDFAQASSQSQ